MELLDLDYGVRSSYAYKSGDLKGIKILIKSPDRSTTESEQRFAN
jgi:hypothetical protein